MKNSYTSDDMEGICLFLKRSAPAHLAEHIIAEIALLERRSAQVRAGVYGVIALFSTAGLITAVWYSVQEFMQSTFLEYISLLATDAGSLTHVWQEFVLSLLESVPLVGMTLAAAAILIVLWSGAGFVRAVKPAFTSLIHA